MLASLARGLTLSQEWLHITINRSPSAPPHVKEEQPTSPQETWHNAQYVARNATPTSPGYREQTPPHASMSWTDCNDDGCLVHTSEKQGSGWYPQLTRRSKQPSVAHDQEWRQHMEDHPGEDWAPQQHKARKSRRAHKDIVGWEHCFKDDCRDHRWEKVDAGYYPRQIGERGQLSRKDENQRRKRKTVRTRLGREGSEKTVPDVEALERQISDLRGQLDAAAQIIVAKDNEIEGLNKDKEKLQISLQRVKHRMRQLGAELWRGGA